MGIERFWTELIYIYSKSASSTYPYDETWTQITGSPFYGSFTELSGDRAKVGGATEARADAMITMDATNAVLEKHKIKYDNRYYEIVIPPKKFPEHPNHHQEIFVHETPEFVLS
jgi:hypothetical protein